jgi:hypothetical protein
LPTIGLLTAIPITDNATSHSSQPVEVDCTLLCLVGDPYNATYPTIDHHRHKQAANDAGTGKGETMGKPQQRQQQSPLNLSDSVVPSSILCDPWLVDRSKVVSTVWQPHE